MSSRRNRVVSNTSEALTSTKTAAAAATEMPSVDFTGGGIHQLVKAASAKPQAAFPRKLSETGIFTSTKDNKVAPGIIPYSVNAQL